MKKGLFITYETKKNAITGATVPVAAIVSHIAGVDGNYFYLSDGNTFDAYGDAAGITGRLPRDEWKLVKTAGHGEILDANYVVE